jgi:hypothetical protein
MVVPMLAPYTIPKAWRILSKPALTKPKDATVTALEDCTKAVIAAPDTTPLNGVLLHLASKVRSELPAASLSPSVIIPMASKNRPNPPIMLPTSKTLSICLPSFLYSLPTVGSF